MKPTSTAILYLVAAFFAPLMALAAPLTWDACVKEASQNNRDLRIAIQTAKSAENSRNATFGQWLPQITLGSSLSRSGLDNSVGGALSNPFYTSGASVNVGASETLFNGFRDFASTDIADAQLELAKAQLDQAKAQLSHDLKVAFYQLLFSQRQIILLQKIRDRDKANEDLVQMNFDGGTDNKGSLYRAQASTAQDDFSVAQATRALRVAQRQLSQVLGRTGMEKLEVEGDFDIPELATGTPDLAALTSASPAHRQALARYHSAQGQAASARGTFFPTLTANASMGGSGTSYDTMGSAWSATLSLNFPIFTGGRDFFDLQSAEESEKGAKASLESSDLRTQNALESAYASYADAVQETKVQHFEVKAAQAQEEISKAEYLNGLLIFQNWNQIEENLTNQQKAELASLLSVKTTEANWELSQGKGVIP